jgi:hypothetical protein
MNSLFYVINLFHKKSICDISMLIDTIWNEFVKLVRQNYCLKGE